MELSDYCILAKEASEGRDNFKKGAVGADGYGFVFTSLKDASFIGESIQETSQLCCLRDFQEFVRKAESLGSNILLNLDEEKLEDIEISGTVKTLVPSVEYGGYELLFEVALIVRAPREIFFPLIFYYGASGLALGSYNSEKELSLIGKIFNFNPFHYNELERKSLVKALCRALQKVSSSNFYGVYQHDFGNSLMAMKNGRRFTMELSNVEPSFVAFLYDFI